MNMSDVTGYKREPKSKLLPLKEAVRRYVKPGIKLHLAGGIGGPSTAICEIIRQYYGTTPGFVLIQSTVSGHAINLLHCNLVRKLIFSACVDISNSGRPSKIIQKAWAEKSVELENWSLLSLQQRLMAGALGISFMPTHSIAKSSMALDNKESFKEIDDPFGGKVKVGLVKALNPDISIVHGCVADAYGNTILATPYGDDLWGPLASSQVLITVERIVPTDFVRKYAALVKIPGYIVKAVSMAPLGVHPFSLANPGISDFNAYETDLEFLQDLHKASADSHKLDNWIKEWVIGCATPEDYLNKLGSQRIMALQKINIEGTRCQDFSVAPLSSEPEQEYSPEEMMLIVAAREITRSVLKSKHGFILTGAGSGAVAVSMAYYQLKAKEYEIGLITGNGQIGYEPQPVELARQSVAGVYSSKMLTDTITTYSVFVGGRNSKCLSVLGAGQIDKYGNVNSTKLSKGQFLVGSGGANDAANAKEVIVILNQSKDRFPETLPYITCPGDRVTTVVSTMGVFTKPAGKRELHLTACFPDPKLSSLEDKIKKVQDHCGWPLKLDDRVKELPKPTPDELRVLRWLVPLCS